MRATIDIARSYARHALLGRILWAMIGGALIVTVAIVGHWPTAVAMYLVWWLDNFVKGREG